MVDDAPASPSRRSLEASELEAGLRPLPGWWGDGSGITRVVEAASFPAAIDMVVAVAGVSEAMDHHPDIDIRWRTVRFALVTHSSGGVTETDLEAARAIDKIIATADT